MELKKGFTIYLEEDLKEKLVKEGRLKRRSPSSIINELLEEHLKEVEDASA